MNMISTGAFLNEMDASDKQKTSLVNKLVDAWEQKNSKTARAGGVSLMALSLAACGSSDDTSDAVSYSQAQLDAATASATSAAEATAATAAAAAAAAASAAQDAAVAAAVAAVDTTADDGVAVSLALRNAAAEAGATTFDGMSDAAMIAAIKASDNSGIADAAVVALGISGVSTLAALNTAYDALANPTVTDFTLGSSVVTTAGSAANDTFSGVLVGANAAGTTLNAGDIINGGDGTDTFTLAVSGSGGAIVNIVGVQTSSIESFMVSNFDTHASITDVDATLMTGLATVGLKASSSTGDTEFSNLANIVDAEMASGTADLTLVYTTAASTGSNTQNLAVMNQTAGTATIANVETVNVSSTLAANTLADLVIANATALNVTGDQNLTITADVDFADAAVATAVDGTVDASAFTGNLAITANTGDVVSVTGGSGDDTINFTTGMATTDTVDGGAGVDTVTMTGAANSSTTTLSTFGFSNVEKYSVAGVDEASITVAAASVSDLTHVVLVENADGGDNDGDTYAITGLASGATVVLENSVNARDMNAVTLTLADASGTSDVLTVELNGTSGHAAADNSVNDLSVLDVETLNLVSGQSGTTALTATDDNTLDDLSSDTTLTTLNISGSAESNITIGTEATKLATINASGMTAASTLTVAAAADQTITGGSAVDTITMAATLNNADTIDGGAGTDTMTATSTSWTATTGALNVSNVETLNLTNGGTSVINAAGISGATEIAVLTNTTSTTITNLAAGINVGLGHNNTDGASVGLLDVSLADATGTSDTLTFNLNDTEAGAATAELKATGIESVTIDLTDDTDTSLADYTLDVDSINATTLTVTGGTLDTSGTLALTALDTDTTTLDASGYGGILTATTATAVATNVTVAGDRLHVLTGSSKADTFTVGNTTGSAVTLDAGAGTDTLNMTLGDGVQDFDLMSNIENINFTIAASADITTNADGDVLDGINTASSVTFSGGNVLSSVTLGGAADTLDGDAKTVNTILDFSTFGGNIADATFLLDSFDNDTTGITVQVIGSANSTDTVSASYDGDNSAAVQVNMQGVETFDVDYGNSGTEVVMDMSLVTGLTEVNVTDNSSERIDFNNLAAGVTIDATTTDATATTIEIRQAVTSGTESQTIKAKAASANDNLAVVMADVETLTVKADSATIVDLELANVSMTTAGAVSTLNFTGANDINLISLHADVTTIDASGMTTGGAVVQTGRSATAATTVTGSVGNDTFIHMNGGDSIAGGAGTGDTLDINKTAILGGISVDLSSTTNQVATYNGGAATGTTTGFENVDLGGYANFGAEITAIKGGSTIAGSTSADVITLGAGSDVVQVNDSTTDTIGSFTLGTDRIDISISALEAVGGTGSHAAATNYVEPHDGNDVAAGVTVVITELVQGADTADADGAQIFVLLTGTFATDAAVLTGISSGGTHEIDMTASQVTAGEGLLVVYSDGTDAKLASVRATATQNAASLVAAELQLTNIATLSGVGGSTIAAGEIAAANFAFIA